MSRDSKNRKIMEGCLIDRILLIEQYWVKSRDEITCGKAIGKREVWSITF